MRHRVDSVYLLDDEVSFLDGEPVSRALGKKLISSQCFIEESGGEGSVFVESGVSYTYSYIIHLDIIDKILKRGDKISITKMDGSIIDLVLEVKKFFIYPNVKKAIIWA